MLTILTPTYNRAHTLTRLFNSLCQQEDHDFEWLIVDDGSSDNTNELLQSLINNACFPIHVISQKNSGKHVALNTGVASAQREWVFVVDSDDALTPDAVKIIYESISELSNEHISGICFRRAYFDKKIIGVVDGLPAEKLKLKPTEAGRLLKGDLAYIFKKSIMSTFPFPIIIGEKFVPELYIWNKIGAVGDIYFFVNKAIYLCEYLVDGYTKNFKDNLKKNPKGFLLFYWSQINIEKNIFHKVKCIIRSIQCLIYSFNKN